MKKLLFAAMMLMPLAATAQDNTWEQTEKKTTEDTRYLAGAVPEVDGRVVFETTIQAPGKSAKQIFTLLRDDMQKMTKEPNQIEQSRVSLADAATGELVGQFQEWLVFKNKPLVLDRTRFFYTLMINCKDGAADVKLTRIHYLYDEERDATTYKAEEWITDQYGLNRKQNKLARVSGKFRRKTIDRKDYIFARFTNLLQK
jgi:colicin import membrane protein